MNNSTLAPRRCPLPSAKAVVWLTATDTVSQRDLLARYVKLLDGEEHRRWRAFRFAVDRHVYLVAHALLRTTLSRYHGLAPAAWRFSAGRFGRPGIANHRDRGRFVHFNLSHTRGLAACAVTRGVDIGVDVERLDRQVAELAIARRCWSPRETERLAALPPCQRAARFLEYWTLKEAYVKALGCGLSIPLDGFWFDRDPAGVWRLAGEAATVDDPRDWQFACVRVTPSHLLSVAMRCPRGFQFDVELRMTVPLSCGSSGEALIRHT